jgi:tRNA nucleotidyltransferase (CCA-adding enzyme)
MNIYKVGGAVRDRLLGRAVKDCDWVVVGGSAEALLAAGYRQVGQDFPVFLHPQTQEEYALARTERKRGTGYRGFDVDASAAITLEEDLARRDLTINAMAEDASGAIIDPYGGQADLAAGILRHVAAAFVEDPLRVLRVARFAARFGFPVAPDTMTLMRTLSASGELATLPPERLWRELERALTEPFPWRFVEVLRECGALAALLPEIDALFGVPQPPQHHPEIDCGEHLLLTLRQAARLGASPAVCYAVLLHDLGKAETTAEYLPGHRGHHEASARLAEAVSRRLRAPQAFRELAVLVARHHVTVHQALALRPGTLVDLLEKLDAFRRPERFEEVLLACLIDATGRGGKADSPYPQAERLRQAFAVLRAQDLQAVIAAAGGGAAVKEAIRAARITRLQELPSP